jgi:hypothetical protein
LLFVDDPQGNGEGPQSSEPVSSGSESEPGDATIKRAVKDIKYLESAVNQRVTSFSWPLELQFRSRSSPEIAFTSEFTLGPCGVSQKRHSETSRLCVFEDWLIEIYATAIKFDTYENKPLIFLKNGVIQQIVQTLQRIDRLKAHEWQKQAQSGNTMRHPERKDGAVFFDTGKSLILMHMILPTLIRKSIFERGCISSNGNTTSDMSVPSVRPTYHMSPFCEVLQLFPFGLTAYSIHGAWNHRIK